MQLIIHQSIVIHQLKVGSVSNSSVLQIGTAGSIRSLSNLYNSGGFTGPAPEAGVMPGQTISPLPFVPLPGTAR
ncbi:spore germination protein GerPB [Paenibacillus filicis]|uniref:Spore germination protein GerPB n=1 Tax=Paenibacillus gyeongsangnamensis TaxID=3388067 RepID=A0ABT4Q3B7_9BACL|nr:spore germination protein GerPB [Paenibacillus filicis]MCZ8511303.1 spore germination protein GerPB [Paenibacillus filicis]